MNEGELVEATWVQFLIGTLAVVAVFAAAVAGGVVLALMPIRGRAEDRDDAVEGE